MFRKISSLTGLKKSNGCSFSVINYKLILNGPMQKCTYVNLQTRSCECIVTGEEVESEEIQVHSGERDEEGGCRWRNRSEWREEGSAASRVDRKGIVFSGAERAQSLLRVRLNSLQGFLSGRAF